MKRSLALFLATLLFLSGCHSARPAVEETQIHLSDEQITVDGNEISADSDAAVYSAKDIVFYPTGKDFTYGEGTEEDAHEQSEADSHTVVHITKPGNYILSGSLSAGQVAIDLGEEAKEDPEAVVNLILNEVDITCTVAPAIIFYNVYECGNSEEETATMDVDTQKAGANVIIADGSENYVNGSYVAKIYKSYELSEDGKEVVDSKKLHKYDGAFYSRMTMNIDGEEKGDGVLHIQAENEGLDSELHLTINGGIIHITSGNDGINTNEDNVSVTTINGGRLNILCDGSTGEGDGIDSNGWLIINGGSVISQACGTSGDAGIDSDKGIYIHGGSVVASGNMLDPIAGGEQTYAVFQFADKQSGNSTYTLKDAQQKTVGTYTPKNTFSYLILAGDELSPGDYTFWQGENQLAGSKAGEPQGIRPQPPEEGMTEPPKGMEQPEGQPPQMPDGEAPERPTNDDSRPSEGEVPELPQGERPEPPEGMHPGENKLPAEESSQTFPIQKGGNQFSNVAPLDVLQN